MSYNTATPHIASYLILEKGDKVALLLRKNAGWMNGHYGLVSGKVEKNESFKAAAIREAKEEAGININPKNLEVVLTVHRVHPDNDDNLDWVDVIFKVTKWSGKAYNAEPEVHSELGWFNPKNLPENTIPSVKYMLELVELGEIYGEHGWGGDHD